MNVEEYRRIREGKTKIKKEPSKLKKRMSLLINQILLTIIFFLIGLIMTRNNASVKDFINKNIYTSTFQFMKVKKLYNQYIGKYFGEKDAVAVFTEKLSYSKEKTYQDGVELTVAENYLVPSIESGIVIFMGEKDGYGSTVIIEQINGIDVWYSNIEAKNIKMYDYVEKGSLIGEVKYKKLILVFQKEGKSLNYKEYI